MSGSLKMLLALVTSVDAIGYNHFYNTRGGLVFEQAIFYEIDPDTRKHVVRAYTLVDDRETPNRRPHKNETTGLYEVRWYDKDKRISRVITSRVLVENWTMLDPERDNLKILPDDQRHALPKPLPCNME